MILSLFLSSVALVAVGSRVPEKPAKEQVQKTLPMDRKSLEARIRENPSLRLRLQVASCGILLLWAGSIWGIFQTGLKIFRGDPVAVSLGEPAAPGWRLREILRLVLGVVLVSQWALLIKWGILLSTLLVDGVIIGAAGLLFLRRVRSAGKRVFDGSKAWASFRFGIMSYLTSLPFLLGLILLWGFLLSQFQYEPKPQPILTMVLNESRTPILGWLLFLVVVVGPVAEEMFFRGLLYGWLRVRIGVGRALILSALLFAGLHANLLAFLPIIGLGLLLGWVYERTGSLAVPIAVHLFHNGGMMILAFLAKSLLVPP
ncbi:MAG: CPBP family intramembrane metalloprotease [Candidatus Omnitrophica bacterium]|nr:CPBP family intramembrane metalloprotease [Candidatus Omnitrophota bacterium]